MIQYLYVMLIERTVVLGSCAISCLFEFIMMLKNIVALISSSEQILTFVAWVKAMPWPKDQRDAITVLHFSAPSCFHMPRVV